MCTTTTAWLGSPAAAEYIGVTLRTLYKFVDAGEIRAYRIGRVLRYRPVDLDEFLEANLVRPGDSSPAE